ncbi:MAG: hypothetical protein GY835_02720 [bacterium]|nr:hypothetical protein [bacterium]
MTNIDSRERLSVKSSPYSNYDLVIILAGLLVLGVWLGIKMYNKSQQLSDVLEFGVIYLFALLFVGAIYYRIYTNLKEVTLSGSALEISDLKATIEVPLRDIESVSGGQFPRSGIIWIHLKKQTKFGRSIPFLGEQGPPVGLSEHPTATRLKILIEKHGL